jgi:hypothetical protein
VLHAQSSAISTKLKWKSVVTSKQQTHHTPALSIVDGITIDANLVRLDGDNGSVSGSFGDGDADVVVIDAVVVAAVFASASSNANAAKRDFDCTVTKRDHSHCTHHTREPVSQQAAAAALWALAAVLCRQRQCSRARAA